MGKKPNQSWIGCISSLKEKGHGVWVKKAIKFRGSSPKKVAHDRQIVGQFLYEGNDSP
jgi:hypothetical protein